MDKAEDHRQKLYHDNFASSRVKAFDKVFLTTRIFTLLRQATELILYQLKSIIVLRHQNLYKRLL